MCGLGPKHLFRFAITIGVIILRKGPCKILLSSQSLSVGIPSQSPSMDGKIGSVAAQSVSRYPSPITIQDLLIELRPLLSLQSLLPTE